MKLITIIPKRYTETVPANVLSERLVGSKQHTVGTTFKQAVWLVKNLYALGKKVIGISGIGGYSKKRHHKPLYIKTYISAVQKQFAIEKSGEVNPIKTRAICKQQYANDQYTNILITKHKREHAKYTPKREFKLQFW